MPSPPVQCKKFAKATSQPHHFRIPKQGRQEAGTESLAAVVQPVTDCCGHGLPSKEEKDRGLSAILSPNEASQFHRSPLLALLCKSHHFPIETRARKEKSPLRCLPTNWSSGAMCTFSPSIYVPGILHTGVNLLPKMREWMSQPQVMEQIRAFYSCVRINLFAFRQNA